MNRREALREITAKGASIIFTVYGLEYLNACAKTAPPREKKGRLQFSETDNLIPGRPVTIIRDNHERENVQPTFEIASARIPPPVAIVTPEMKSKGYRKINDNSYQPSIPIPLSLEQTLRSYIEPLHSLHAKSLDPRIEFYPLDQSLQDKYSIDGEPIVQEDRIIVDVKPNTAIPLKELEIVAFHERLHFIQEQVLPGFGWGNTQLTELQQQLAQDQYKLIHAYEDRLTKEGTDPLIWSQKATDAENGGTTFFQLGPLDLLITEGSYYGQGGHPWDNPGELWVSTINVLHHFPKSFMRSVQALTLPQDRLLITNLAKQCVRLLRNYSDTQQKADALFQPELLQFLKLAS